jgi:hypothetical protein
MFREPMTQMCGRVGLEVMGSLIPILAVVWCC